MTHPLTPREKVAQIIKEKVSGPHFTDPSHFVAMEQDRFVAADAILTALASGSGDHAELAAKAERCTTGDPWYKDEDLRGRQSFGQFLSQDRAFIAAANPATVLALLAESAALRAEREHFESEFKRQCGATADVMDRATEAERALSEHRIAADLLVSTLKADKSEAERKLAEAVGLLEVCEASMDAGCVGSHRIALNTIRPFLSKEAERG